MKGIRSRFLWIVQGSPRRQEPRRRRVHYLFWDRDRFFILSLLSCSMVMCRSLDLLGAKAVRFLTNDLAEQVITLRSAG